MSTPTLGVSELDARLAEVDRRLREIQAGLAPDALGRAAPRAADGHPPLPEAPASEDDPAPPRSPRAGPLATLLARSRRRRTEADVEDMATLVRMHSGLLEAVGELVRMLGATARAPLDEPSPVAQALVSAGPFTDTRQVEDFVLTLAALESVDEASVLGYEGSDRALIEVRLIDPSG